MVQGIFCSYNITKQQSDKASLLLLAPRLFFLKKETLTFLWTFSLQMTWYDMFELKMNFHMNFQLVLLEI